MTRLGSLSLSSRHPARYGLNPDASDYYSYGTELLRQLIRYAGLRPASRILDVGCGTGRLGHALRGYLVDGQYHGVDVHRQHIDHCRAAFRFRGGYSFYHHDQQHPEWNRKGSRTDLPWPHEPGSYDLVTMLHVLPTQDFPRAAQLIHRAGCVLCHYGYLVCTARLLNHYSMAQLQPQQYSYRTPNAWHMDAARPLLGVAHPEEGFRRALIRSRLQVRDPVRYGRWYDGEGPDDLVVALKV